MHAPLERPATLFTRWTPRVLIALLAGALTTCTVCWAIAMLKRPQYNHPFYFAQPRNRPNEWKGNVTASFGDVCIYAYSSASVDLDQINSIKFPDERWRDTQWSLAYSLSPASFIDSSMEFAFFEMHERATGWPLSAMAARRIDALENRKTLLHRELFNKGVAAKELRIPIEPIPTGFVINSMIYAGAWLVMLTIAAQLRAAHRRRRGLCASCKYPVAAGNARCPECGTQLHPGTSASSRSDLSTSR